jgi:hypothetical protein
MAEEEKKQIDKEWDALFDRTTRVIASWPEWKKEAGDQWAATDVYGKFDKEKYEQHKKFRLEREAEVKNKDKQKKENKVKSSKLIQWLKKNDSK